jgi:hypothetical protein
MKNIRNHEKGIRTVKKEETKNQKNHRNRKVTEKAANSPKLDLRLSRLRR